MWGAYHEDDPRSLMYPTLGRTSEWSSYLEEYINRNLDRQWWRAPEHEIPKTERRNLR
jgi:hypothetical protein